MKVTGIDIARACQWVTPVDMMKAYNGPNVIDYGKTRAGRGLLLTTGAGLLMSTMDQLPTARWAVDVGGGRGISTHREWLEAAALCSDYVAVVSWFTVTTPQVFFNTLDDVVNSNKLHVYSHPDYTGLGKTYPTLTALCDALC